MNIRLFLLLFCLSPLLLVGQRTDKLREKRAQVQQLKHDYIKQELQLSAQEEIAFLTLYNHFEDQYFEVRNRRLASLNRQIGSLESLSDTDAAILLEQIHKAENQLVSLRVKLHLDLEPVIGVKKILKLRRAEAEFQRKLLQQYRGRRR